MLTLEALLERISNEEKDVEKAGFKILHKQLFCDPLKKKEYKEIEVPTVYGLEKIPAVVKFTFEMTARGYTLDRQERVSPQHNHVFDLYILRNYPFPTNRRLGAPVRVVWITPIFHPNISPGVDYGGTGVICLRALNKWVSTFNLRNLLEGIRLLVENPDVEDPIHNPPICLRAAEYFKKTPPPRIVKVRKEQAGDKP